jgi:predicted ATP-grasp superfamily ATP-dependent carboligase
MMPRLNNLEDNPGAFIIDGHGKADLGLVRALGEGGIPIYLATNERRNAVCHSRFITQIFDIPPADASDEEKLSSLVEIGKRFAQRPVFFSTGDSSLLFFSRHRRALEAYYRHHIGRSDIIEACADKIKFARLAEELHLAVPASIVPTSRAQIAELSQTLRFPVMVKPSEKKNWDRHMEIYRIVGGNLKGVRVDTVDKLLRLYDELTPFDNNIVVQEYIDGRDENIFSLHTYIDREGHVIGWFTGQKIRTYPIHRGIGCFQRSVINTHVRDIGLEILHKIGYTGHAIVQVKRLPGTETFQAFEINCRYSTWNYLHTKAGVNLPLAAYQESLGYSPAILPTQIEGVRWIDTANDIKAFRAYRNIGEWTWTAWLRSYCGRNCYVEFAANDPLPWVMMRRFDIGDVVSAIRRRVKLGG